MKTVEELVIDAVPKTSPASNPTMSIQNAWGIKDTGTALPNGSQGSQRREA